MHAFTRIHSRVQFLPRTHTLHRRPTFITTTSRYLASSVVIDGNAPVSVLHFSIDGLYETKSLTKERILRESRLAARDYVVIAQGFSRLPKPALLVRSDAIVVSLYEVRAVIHHDRVLVFNPNLEKVKRFAPLFSSYLKLAPMSLGNFDEPPDFELRALEGILDLCTDAFAKRASLLNPLVDGVLKNLATCSILESFDAIHEHLLPLKEILSQFEIEATLIRNVLADVLKSNEDMLNMRLTEKHNRLGDLPPVDSHHQVELLLEAYLSKFIDMAQLAYYLRKRVESNQSIFELRLGSHRNRMMNYNLQLSMMSIGFAWSTTFFGMFGMNLLSGIETVTILPFWVIVFLSTGSAFAFYRWLVTGLLHDPISTSRMSTLKTGSGGMASIFTHLDEIQTVILNGVSKEEFQNSLSSLRISEEAAAILWSALDRDKDGKLSMDELSPSSMLYPLPGNLKSPPTLEAALGGRASSTLQNVMKVVIDSTHSTQVTAATAATVDVNDVAPPAVTPPPRQALGRGVPERGCGRW